MNRCLQVGLVLAVTMAAAATTAIAGDRAVIEDGAARDTDGRIAINQAAGVGNAQLNQAVLAPQQAVAAALANGMQAVQPGERRRNAQARIEGDAFAGSHGALAANQAAGSGNAQANLLVIGPHAATTHAAATNSIVGLDDTTLSTVSGSPPPEGPASTPVLRKASIDPDSFRGARGVVQVNQTAGVGNASVNAIVLQLPGGGR